MLVSSESSHVTRTIPFSTGFGAEEVGNELLVQVAEQRRLWREQGPGDVPERS